MIRRVLLLAGVAALIGSHWWVWATAERHGRQAVQIEVQQARDRLEVELQRQAQITRDAAEAIRAAEKARDRAIQEAIDALSPDDRNLGLTAPALGVLRAIR